jgi:hypothetical protein
MQGLQGKVWITQTAAWVGANPDMTKAGKFTYGIIMSGHEQAAPRGP